MRRKPWTEEDIISAIREVVDNLELDRMPSYQEMKDYHRDSALTNAISKHQGVYYYANIMGLEVKASETLFGKLGESDVMEKLIGDGYEVTKMPQNFPYDLLVNDALKIDVKASKLYRGKTGSFYSFNLEKPFCTCDIYVLRTIDDENQEKYYVIPSCHIYNKTQISIGEKKSVYSRYLDRWDYISDYCDFFSEVS